MTVIVSASSSVGFLYLSSAGGNNDPCLLEEACEFGRKLKLSSGLTTRILFTGPAHHEREQQNMD